MSFLGSFVDAMRPLPLKSTGERISFDLSAIIEHTVDIAVIIDTDSRVQWVSRTIEQLAGWPADELLGMQWHTLLHPNDVDRFAAALRGARSRTSKLELRVRCAHTRHRWFNASIRLVEPSAGNGHYIIGMHDIDDDVRLREQQKWSEVGLRRLFDDVPDPVVLWQPIRNDHGQVVDLLARKTNRAFESLFGGFSPEGRLASSFAPLALRALDEIERLLKSGGHTSFISSPTPDRRYHVNLSLTGVGEVVTVMRDITEIPVVESDQLSRSESLQEIADQVRHLARMAHTLRTNLSVVQGWTELLEDPALVENTELRGEAISNIARNARRLVETVNLLMDAASGDGKRYEVPISKVEVCPIVEQAVADLQHVHPNTAVRVHCDRTPVAYGEPAALDTIVRHLLENALRFANTSVDVVIRSTLVSVELTIRDDGPGIPDDVELFRPFTPNHNGDGHGLGLHVVSTLVEALNGYVQGRNREDGQGAEFVLSLPAVVDV